MVAIRKVLQLVKENEVSAKKAYKMLYKGKNIKSPKWIKINFWLKEKPVLSSFINIFFILPWPLFIIKRLIIRQMVKNDPKMKEYAPLMFSKGTSLFVNVEDIKLKVKMI